MHKNPFEMQQHPTKKKRINYAKYSDNKEVQELLKELRDIERQINRLDPEALMNMELDLIKDE